MKRFSWREIGIVAAAALAMGLPSSAAFADPPSRVARLNYIKGDVSFRPAALEEWGAATLNRPLTTGDHLWTDADAWTEMHVGSTALRMAPQTAFAFLNLDDRLVQVRLSEGALDVRVRHLSGDVEIDTPSAAITFRRPGIYRVEVAPDEGATRVTVREGEAEVYGEESPFSVFEGQTASIYGTDQVSHEIYRAGPADEWERWCRSRDDREDRSVSARYVSYEMTGYEDLDEYGTWSSIPDYGWAWRPRVVAAGWAPYRYGHWSWVDPWGWTWIDDAAWGFAPFHYGRWAHHHGNWWWVPGAYIARPVYAPALVAFIGGRNWGLSLGFGFHNALAWFPLGPREFWMPHYHASHTYIRNLNITHVNVRNINISTYDVSRGTYVNRAVSGAVTAVPRDAFVGGRAVPRSAFAIDRNAAMRSGVVATGAPAAPRTESLLPRGGGRVPQPTTAALRRAVVARNEPPAAAVPFRARERALQASNGRPLDENTLSGLRATSRPSSVEGPVRLAGARAVRRGGTIDAGRGGEIDARPGNADSTSRPASQAGSGGERAVPRSGERARTNGGLTDWRRADPSSPANVGRDANDRPAWARPRGGFGTGTPSDADGRDEGGLGGARPRAGAGSAWTGSSRGADNDRPGAAVGSARGRGDEGGARNAPSREAGGSDRPPAAGGARGGAGSPGSAVGGARPRGGTGESRPPSSSGGGPGAQQSRPSPSGRPPGDVSGARPRSSGGQAMQMRSAPADRAFSPSWGGDDNSRPATSRYRPAPDYGASSRDYRSTTTPRYGSDRGYRASPPSGSSTPSATFRSAPQYRSSAPSTGYRAAPQYRSSTPSASEFRSAPQYRSSAPSAPQYRATPQYRSSAPSYERPSGGGSRPSFGGGGARPSGGGMPSFGGGAARPSGGGGAASRPSGGNRGGGSSGGRGSSGGGGARPRSRG